MATDYSIPIIGTVIGILTTTAATVAGFYNKSVNARFKKIEVLLDSKQFKDICTLEHTYLREKLDRIDVHMVRSTEIQTEMLKTLAKFEQHLDENKKKNT